MEQQEHHLQWSEHPEHQVPEHILSSAEDGTLSSEFTSLPVRMSVRKIHTDDIEHFHAHLGDSLKRVYEKAAEALDEPLLPPPPSPTLDVLLFHAHDGEWQQPTCHLDTPLWEALAEGMTRHLGIEYRLVVRINAKWGVAKHEKTTPRELLVEFGFDPAQFSLYRCDSKEPLPPDVSLHLHRGEHFEAQKDGRYGGTASLPAAVRGLQSIENDVAFMQAAGESVELLSEGGQRFVAANISIPSPPWSSSTARILIAIPSSYPTAALDAFYVDPASVTVTERAQPSGLILGQVWNLISWHYSQTRPWNSRIDDLQSHVTHCRGFFLQRGVVAQ